MFNYYKIGRVIWWVGRKIWEQESAIDDHEVLRPKQHHCSWASFVCKTGTISNHAFILWLAAIKKLQTRDRPCFCSLQNLVGSVQVMKNLHPVCFLFVPSPLQPGLRFVFSWASGFHGDHCSATNTLSI